jgi:hypothetical protein
MDVELEQVCRLSERPSSTDLDLQHPELSMSTRRWLMGRVAALIHDVLPAAQIVDAMVAEASSLLDSGRAMVVSDRAKL